MVSNQKFFFGGNYFAREDFVLCINYSTKTMGVLLRSSSNDERPGRV